MPAGDTAAGKARYRERRLQQLRAEGRVVTKDNLAQTITEQRATYDSTPTRSFEELKASGYRVVGEFEGRIQQFQRASVCIVVLHVPNAYRDEVLNAQDAQGSLYFRVYAPPPWDEYEYSGDAA